MWESFSFIDRYSAQLFKKNINYIAIFGFLILLNFYIFTFQIAGYYGAQEKLVSQREELKKFTEQKGIVGKYQKSEIQKLYQTIAYLVPDREDYFSIISAVENLSSLTGLEVVSYSVLFSSSNSERIVLKVEAKGSLDALMNFLEKYQYEGGRLITMDKIEFSNKDFRSTLDLNFYTKKIDVANTTDVKLIDPKTVTLFNKINSIILKENSTSGEYVDLDQQYEAKPNPFN